MQFYVFEPGPSGPFLNIGVEFTLGRPGICNISWIFIDILPGFVTGNNDAGNRAQFVRIKCLKQMVYAMIATVFMRVLM